MKRAVVLVVLLCGPARAEKIKIEGGLGSLDQEQVQGAVDASAEGFEICFKGQAEKFRHLGGAARLMVRVARDGTIRKAYVDSGDLGSWTAEKCILGRARAMQFGQPKGGEAQVEVPLEFIAWTPADPGDAEELESKLVKALAKCEGAPKASQVTVYVGPGGRIKSAGFAGELNEAWGDCAAKALAKVRLRDPRGRMLKVTGKVP